MSSDNALLPPGAVDLLARVSARAAQIGAIVDVADLETPEADSRARELLRVIETEIGAAEDERKRIKAPHLKRGQEIDAAFKGPCAALGRVGDLLRRRLSEAAVKRERERTEALRLAAEAARAGDHVEANAQIQIANPAPAPVAAGVSDRFTYEARSFDVRAMPVEYLTVDMPRVKAEIAAANREGREPKIPGVVFERVAAFRVSKL